MRASSRKAPLGPGPPDLAPCAPNPPGSARLPRRQPPQGPGKGAAHSLDWGALARPQLGGAPTPGALGGGGGSLAARACGRGALPVPRSRRSPRGLVRARRARSVRGRRALRGRVGGGQLSGANEPRGTRRRGRPLVATGRGLRPAPGAVDAEGRRAPTLPHAAAAVKARPDRGAARRQPAPVRCGLADAADGRLPAPPKASSAYEEKSGRPLSRGCVGALQTQN